MREECKRWKKKKFVFVESVVRCTERLWEEFVCRVWRRSRSCPSQMEHIVKKWVGRVGGDGRGGGAERTSQSGVPISGRNIENNKKHIQDGRRRCAASCYPDLVCGVIFSCFPRIRPLVFQSESAGGKRKRFVVWIRVDSLCSRGGCEKAHEERELMVT